MEGLVFVSVQGVGWKCQKQAQPVIQRSLKGDVGIQAKSRKGFKTLAFLLKNLWLCRAQIFILDSDGPAAPFLRMTPF
jgi:hypothetical protein